jgi:hypothetical protein
MSAVLKIVSCRACSDRRSGTPNVILPLIVLSQLPQVLSWVQAFLCF